MKRLLIACSAAILVAACTKQPLGQPIEMFITSSVSSTNESTASSVLSIEEPTEHTFELESDTYINQAYGFSVKVPPNTTVEERDNYIRLQNYSPDDNPGLETGEYYLEIHTAPAEAWGPCAEKVVDAKKVVVSNIEGYRGLGKGGGDAGGERFALCLEAPGQYYYVQATENSDTGPIANAILDSFTLIR
jgi:hypothetical protein